MANRCRQTLEASRVPQSDGESPYRVSSVQPLFHLEGYTVAISLNSVKFKRIKPFYQETQPHSAIRSKTYLTYAMLSRIVLEQIDVRFDGIARCGNGVRVPAHRLATLWQKTNRATVECLHGPVVKWRGYHRSHCHHRCVGGVMRTCFAAGSAPFAAQIFNYRRRHCCLPLHRGIQLKISAFLSLVRSQRWCDSLPGYVCAPKRQRALLPHLYLVYEAVVFFP